MGSPCQGSPRALRPPAHGSWGSSARGTTRERKRARRPGGGSMPHSGSLAARARRSLGSRSQKGGGAMPFGHGGLMHGLLSGQDGFSGWSSQPGAYSAALGHQGSPGREGPVRIPAQPFGRAPGWDRGLLTRIENQARLANPKPSALSSGRAEGLCYKVCVVGSTRGFNGGVSMTE